MTHLDAGLWAATGLAAGAALYGLCRACARLKVRGLLCGRDGDARGGSAPLFLLQEAVEPQSRHVREVEEHAPAARRDEGAEPDGPRLFRNQDRFRPHPPD